MQTKYYLLLFSFISFIFLGCSKEDDGNPVIDTEADIVLDKETIDIQVEEKATVRISEGNGDYNVFSLNEDITTVTLSNNELEIEGKDIGATYIIIADKKTQLKLLPVSVYRYNEILLETSSVDVEFKLGHPGQVRVEVLEGNGKYLVVSEDESVATATVSENTIIVTARGIEGTTNIVVTDASNRQATLSVNTLPTTVPYTEAELAAIMEQTTSPYFIFNGFASYNYFTFLDTVEDGMNLSGYDYFGFYVLRIYYPGDKSVGESDNARIYYANTGGISSGSTLDLDYFKIIKNDGTKIWAVFSLVHNGTLRWGHFIQNI